jgi:hypothetical protein
MRPSQWEQWDRNYKEALSSQGLEDVESGHTGLCASWNSEGIEAGQPEEAGNRQKGNWKEKQQQG